MSLCGFVSAMTGQPLSALAQSLPDPVELLGDGAQPFALMVLALLGAVASRTASSPTRPSIRAKSSSSSGSSESSWACARAEPRGANVIMRGGIGRGRRASRASRRTARRRSAGRLPLRGRQCSGSSGARERRCGHPCPMRPRRPPRVAKSAPGRRPFADRNARSVGCGRLTAPLSETPSAVPGGGPTSTPRAC